MATRAFVDGKINIGVVNEGLFNEKTSREIKLSLSDIDKNRNLSPRFSSVIKAISYLEKSNDHSIS